jgi:hypothetical protein
MSKIAGLFAIAVSISACASSNKASRNVVNDGPSAVYSVAPAVAAPNEQLSFFATTTEVAAPANRVAQVPSQFHVVEVQVMVPENLVVSEADVYVPQADIVWREDPLGDRKAQVKAIMENALRVGTAPLAGQREVIVAARLNTFHALSEKARNSVGGKQNINFDYVLLDATTRKPITTVQNIDASFSGYGGRKAYRAMRSGQTQKVRITDHVAVAIRNALSTQNQI